MTTALVLSGGIGKRLISEVPKQYVTVGGKMIVIYTLEALCAHEKIDAVHVVAERAWWEPILTELPKVSKLKGFSLPGGNRQLSILNGLRDMRDYMGDEDIVLIHDAVRPCVSKELISNTIDALRPCVSRELIGSTIDAIKGTDSGADRGTERCDGAHDGAVPVLPLKDTVYYSADSRSLTDRLERAKILAGQAPEAFLFGKYLAANEALSDKEIHSLSGSAEPALMAGMDIATIPGDEKNFKITTNEDLDRFISIVESTHSTHSTPVSPVGEGL